MNLPWVRRSELTLARAELRRCQRLSRYWYEECERGERAYQKLELRLISLRGELQYERERRQMERVIGIMAAPD